MATPTFVAPQTPRQVHPSSDKPLSITAPADLVSVIVPCCGMLEYTKLLVPSLMRYTRMPFELIFLDIGSLDGTAEYLAGIQAVAPIRIEIVSTPTDMGIAEATRAAFAAARGQHVALLNNDTIVTPHWLEHLIGLVNMSPTLAMVGPMSNYAAPPQLVESVPYRVGKRKAGGRAWELDLGEVQRFAGELAQTHQGKWMEVERLGGFCLLVKKPVLDRLVPELHAWTDLGLFDTDILSAKARQAGFTLACCRDLFIHHFGTRTFAHGAPTKEGNGQLVSRPKPGAAS